VVQYSPAAAHRQLDACDKRGVVKRVSTKKMPYLEVQQAHLPYMKITKQTNIESLQKEDSKHIT
jgi:hypothetical protein